MATGMEILVNTLLKSAGFNPAEMMNGLGAFINMVQTKLADFDTRMIAIESHNEFMRNSQERMEMMLGEMHSITASRNAGVEPAAPTSSIEYFAAAPDLNAVAYDPSTPSPRSQ